MQIKEVMKASDLNFAMGGRYIIILFTLLFTPGCSPEWEEADKLEDMLECNISQQELISLLKKTNSIFSLSESDNELEIQIFYDPVTVFTVFNKKGELIYASREITQVVIPGIYAIGGPFYLMIGCEANQRHK